MTEILSQEEIDALLRGGIGQQPEPKKEKAEKKQTPSPRPKVTEFVSQQPSFSSAGEKEPKSKMKRSSVISESVDVHPAVFESFEDETPIETTNMEVVLNLDLEIRVELGQTNKTVRDVLEMGPGSVIELRRLNGEPVDLLVNNKPFAKGEIIVITGENFGVRVTDISSVKEIIEALR
ncbi:MAG: hypothetical protein C4527_28700 [Candidatus Omnitrophota bacterium]|jgi:flagellar motor switch protein FliN/FliY|nr:MAG: hypothetical protein C4527_28700 [Candidatus Omnitrophota bacterium]